MSTESNTIVETRAIAKRSRYCNEIEEAISEYQAFMLDADNRLPNVIQSAMDVFKAIQPSKDPLEAAKAKKLVAELEPAYKTACDLYGEVAKVEDV